MACLLQRDDTHANDAVGTANTTPRVFIRSKKAPQVKVMAASMGGKKIDVTTSPFKLPALVQGINVLRLVLENVQADDDVELVEKCEGGEERALKEKFVGSAPGGPDPNMGFRIDAK